MSHVLGSSDAPTYARAQNLALPLDPLDAVLFELGGEQALHVRGDLIIAQDFKPHCTNQCTGYLTLLVASLARSTFIKSNAIKARHGIEGWLTCSITFSSLTSSSRRACLACLAPGRQLWLCSRQGNSRGQWWQRHFLRVWSRFSKGFWRSNRCWKRRRLVFRSPVVATCAMQPWPAQRLMALTAVTIII